MHHASQPCPAAHLPHALVLLPPHALLLVALDPHGGDGLLGVVLQLQQALAALQQLLHGLGHALLLRHSLLCACTAAVAEEGHLLPAHAGGPGPCSCCLLHKLTSSVSLPHSCQLLLDSLAPGCNPGRPADAHDKVSLAGWHAQRGVQWPPDATVHKPLACQHPAAPVLLPFRVVCSWSAENWSTGSRMQDKSSDEMSLKITPQTTMCT